MGGMRGSRKKDLGKLGRILEETLMSSTLANTTNTTNTASSNASLPLSTSLPVDFPQQRKHAISMDMCPFEIDSFSALGGDHIRYPYTPFPPVSSYTPYDAFPGAHFRDADAMSGDMVVDSGLAMNGTLDNLDVLPAEYLSEGTLDPTTFPATFSNTFPVTFPTTFSSAEFLDSPSLDSACSFLDNSSYLPPDTPSQFTTSEFQYSSFPPPTFTQYSPPTFSSTFTELLPDTSSSYTGHHDMGDQNLQLKIDGTNLDFDWNNVIAMGEQQEQDGDQQVSLGDQHWGKSDVDQVVGMKRKRSSEDESSEQPRKRERVVLYLSLLLSC